MMTEIIQAILDTIIIDGNQRDAMWQERQVWHEITSLLHTNIVVEFLMSC